MSEQARILSLLAAPAGMSVELLLNERYDKEQKKYVNDGRATKAVVCLALVLTEHSPDPVVEAIIRGNDRSELVPAYQVGRVWSYDL